MKKTLLIMAAGMGSRFGGLKQAEPIGPNGEWIIDYSIYDAVRCGFDKVIFVIKEENYALFKEKVGSRFEKTIETEYVFQNLDNVPKKYTIPEERKKPLGTAHAILCAKDKIDSPFLIINADDFYGYDAFKSISEFASNNPENNIGLVGYDVDNTLTENGSVKRGVCNIKNGNLLSITESKIEKLNNRIQAESLLTGEKFELNPDSKVSMNMILFYPEFLNYIEEKFVDFLENDDLNNDEFLIPNVLSSAIEENRNVVKVIYTNAKWVGVTYKEDKDAVVQYINELIENNEYSRKLKL